MADLSQEIKKRLGNILAIVAAIAILVFALINPQWWGDRGFGIVLGAAALALAGLGAALLLNNFDSLPEWIGVWILVTVPTLTALAFRRTTSQFRLPLQVSVPNLPSIQTALISLLVIAFLILVFALARALARGESVMIESHWGGIGGGTGGWRVSTPLIYLLGLLLLGAIAFGVGWRAFAPMANTKGADPAATPAIAESGSAPTPTSSPAR